MGKPFGFRGHLQVRVRDLGLTYRAGSTPVFDRISHAFSPGSLTLLAGPSGSGKSTLLYVLGLMLTPSYGHVMWNSHVVSMASDAERARLRARHVGFVFQDALLDLSRTAAENIEEAAWLAGLDKRQAAATALELLDRFGVAHRADHRPGEISGGQAQRIALCRALVKQPALILADEPTGNLDEGTAQLVWDTLAQEAADGVTVIVATHDARWLRQGRTVLELTGRPLPTGGKSEVDGLR